ncbi:MAG: DUF342 domain-containing protein [candidate division Zixibacteria bacterium]|nr:DUF342 domain-containing protein [candidate division Zixibacteria bacterium]
MTTSANSTSSDTTQRKARVLVKISGDRLKASVRLATHESDDEPYTTQEIMNALTAEGVKEGIDLEAIEALANGKKTEEFIDVAFGDPPVAGADAALEYLFDLTPDHSPKTDSKGRIDYREVSFVQGAKTGQELVRLIFPTEGTPGIGVDGRPVSASKGKEKKLPIGKNTRISDDGATLLATVDGALAYTKKDVSVRDVITISGNVDSNTGNITSPGSVKVSGDVCGGFKVTADGDIEISGGVEDAEVTAKGNIFVKRGFVGRGDGIIRAEGNVTIQHVENQKIVAGDSVIVGGDLLNARVEAGDRVTLKTKTGSIYGGEIRAENEIRAAVLGSEVWSTTKLKVAMSSDLSEKILEIKSEIKRMENDQERVQEGVFQLLQLQIEGRLGEDKKVALKKLRNYQREMPENIKELEEKKAELEERMAQDLEARIIATEKVYPGVVCHFGVAYLEIRAERDAVIFSSVGGRVLMDDYDPKKDMNKK